MEMTDVVTCVRRCRVRLTSLLHSQSLPSQGPPRQSHSRTQRLHVGRSGKLLVRCVTVCVFASSSSLAYVCSCPLTAHSLALPLFSYKCKNGEHEDSLLLCDGRCGRAAHTFCVGLPTIPEGDWFCSSCDRRRRSMAEAGRRARKAEAERRARLQVRPPTTTSYSTSFRCLAYAPMVHRRGSFALAHACVLKLWFVEFCQCLCVLTRSVSAPPLVPHTAAASPLPTLRRA